MRTLKPLKDTINCLYHAKVFQSLFERLCLRCCKYFPKTTENRYKLNWQKKRNKFWTILNASKKAMKNSKNRRILSLVVIFCICITVFLEFVDKKIMIKIFKLFNYIFLWYSGRFENSLTTHIINDQPTLTLNHISPNGFNLFLKTTHFPCLRHINRFPEKNEYSWIFLAPTCN